MTLENWQEILTHLQKGTVTKGELDRIEELVEKETTNDPSLVPETLEREKAYLDRSRSYIEGSRHGDLIERTLEVMNDTDYVSIYDNYEKKNKIFDVLMDISNQRSRLAKDQQQQEAIGTHAPLSNLNIPTVSAMPQIYSSAAPMDSRFVSTGGVEESKSFDPGLGAGASAASTAQNTRKGKGKARHP